MPISKRVDVAVIGAGGVGSVFVKQLAWLSKRRPDLGLRLIYIAIIDTALYYPDYREIDIDTAIEQLETQGGPLPSITQTIDYLSKAPNRVVAADNTSSQAIANAYPEFLQHGISLITPNKKAFSSDMGLWERIFNATSTEGPFVYHESSVGAGMPVISTLKEMVETGDEITKIEGVFSGTLSYLFNSFAPVGGSTSSWSDEVIKAKNLGYTEPDPRDDLNGLDVARKITILGRLAGVPIESPTAFPVQSLIPGNLENVDSISEFLEKLPRYDDDMEARKTEAQKDGKVLRYIGSVDVTTGQANVGLQWVEKSHPIANLEGSDNIISFYTRRYGKLPLTIRGAGAGGEVTAMGVMGDLLKVASQL